MSDDGTLSDWDAIDSWWTAGRPARHLTRNATLLTVMETAEGATNWTDIDMWWSHVERGDETASDLATVLNESNDRWRESAAPFDTDPLGADLSEGRSRGPPRPAREEAWSRWLARLLRASASFVTELFGIETDEPPEVLREVPLEGRRADLLVHLDRQSVSVEVKRGDTNYDKTAETAALAEEKYADREWTHVLLLPNAQRGELEYHVGEPVTTGDAKAIAWTDPDGDVAVLYWQEVTAALRSVLRRGASPDDHWAANAYLFCALVERYVVGFTPQPVVETLADPDGVVEILRSTGDAHRLGEQLTHFEERLEV